MGSRAGAARRGLRHAALARQPLVERARRTCAQTACGACTWPPSRARPCFLDAPAPGRSAMRRYSSRCRSRWRASYRNIGWPQIRSPTSAAARAKLDLVMTDAALGIMSQAAAHTCISTLRFLIRSPRRYAPSTLSIRLHAGACTDTSRGNESRSIPHTPVVQSRPENLHIDIVTVHLTTTDRQSRTA